MSHWWRIGRWRWCRGQDQRLLCCCGSGQDHQSCCHGQRRRCDKKTSHLKGRPLLTPTDTQPASSQPGSWGPHAHGSDSRMHTARTRREVCQIDSLTDPDGTAETGFGEKPRRLIVKKDGADIIGIRDTRIEIQSRDETEMEMQRERLHMERIAAKRGGFVVPSCGSLYAQPSWPTDAPRTQINKSRLLEEAAK